MRHTAWLLILVLTAAVIVGVFFVPPFAQPLWYHDFADQRCLVCFPHTLNVASNLPFVLVGTWGAAYLLQARSLPGFENQSERLPYLIFFGLIAATGIGSAYYHLDPNNDRLLWDRLPLAMAFMALFAIIIGERINRRAGVILLGPLMVLGGACVVYWHFSETWGVGDLRWYLLVQLYPLLAIPIILIVCPPRYTRTADLYGALVCYLVAKALELLDKPIYSQGQIVSGHTLKHLVAAISPYLILHMIKRRRPLPALVHG